MWDEGISVVFLFLIRGGMLHDIVGSG